VYVAVCWSVKSDGGDAFVPSGESVVVSGSLAGAPNPLSLEAGSLNAPLA
jgi:hypothetical protein